jgi:nitronate monooxygenase
MKVTEMWDANRLSHGLRLPLIAAPMFLVSSPELVIAACRAGIVGAFPTPSCRTASDLEDWMGQITDGLTQAATDNPSALIGPWAANLVAHSSYKRFPEELDLVTRYRPPIVITALGSPRAVVKQVHEYGGLVFADVNNIAHARAAAAVGVDGLVLVCAGAGGHTGQISPFAFVPAVREFFDGLIVVAGSVTDGCTVAAVRVLGADLAYAGTRFIASTESLAAADYKDMILDADAEDLVCTSAFTGAHANMLRPSIERAGLDPDDLTESRGKPDFSDEKRKNRPWKNIWTAGQGVGTVTSIDNVADIVDMFDQQYREATGNKSP